MRKSKETFRLFLDVSGDTVVNVFISEKDAKKLSQDLTDESGEPDITADELYGKTLVIYRWSTPIGDISILHNTGRKS